MLYKSPCCYFWTLVLYTCVCLNTAAAQLVSQLYYTYQEEQPSASLVAEVGRDANVQQVFPDEFPNFIFSINENSLTAPGLFSISTQGGFIRSAKRIDREQICPQLTDCPVEMYVQIFRQVELVHIVKITIEISDINDNAPVFPDTSQTVSFPESSRTGSRVSLLPARDVDSPDYGIVGYVLIDPANTFEIFAPDGGIGSLSDSSLYLMNRKNLDREEQDLYVIEVIVFDGADTRGARNNVSATVNVVISDVNDNSPVFEESSYHLLVSESTPPFHVLTHINATDADTGDNAQIRYEIVKTGARRDLPFDINVTTGVLYTTDKLDREMHDTFAFYVRATDQGDNSLPTTVSVTVHVDDINDNPPVITIQAPAAGVPIVINEGSAADSYVAHLTVLDADSGDNGQYNCSVNSTVFRLEKFINTDYKLVTTQVLDREETSIHVVEMRCEDHGQHSLVGTRLLSVHVQDVNDNKPVFSRSLYTIFVEEESEPPHPLLNVSASDKDYDNNALILYDINPEAKNNFTIHPVTGEIFTDVVFDREDVDRFELFVFGIDQGSTIKHTSTASVIIQITDINDEKPVFIRTAYSFVESENQEPYSYIGQVLALDEDLPPYNDFVYSLTDGLLQNDNFKIDPRTGIIETLAPLDREMASSHRFIAMAASTDGSNFTSTVPITVTVADKNDNPPVFVFPSAHNDTVHVPPGLMNGEVVARVIATDLDIGVNSMLRYSLLPINDTADFPFEIRNDTGQILAQRNLQEFTNTKISMRVSARDQGTPSFASAKILHIVVNATVPYTKDDASTITASIVVVIGCISGLMTVMLITGIVIILIQHRQTEKKHRQLVLSKKVVITPRMRTALPCPPNQQPGPLSQTEMKLACINSQSSDASDGHNTSFSSSSLISDNQADCSTYYLLNKTPQRTDHRSQVGRSALPVTLLQIRPSPEVTPEPASVSEERSSPLCHPAQDCGSVTSDSDITDSGRGSLGGDVTLTKQTDTGPGKADFSSRSSSAEAVIKNPQKGASFRTSKNDLLLGINMDQLKTFPSIQEESSFKSLRITDIRPRPRTSFV